MLHVHTYELSRNSQGFVVVVVEVYRLEKRGEEEREKGSLSTLKRPEIWDSNLDQYYNGINKRSNKLSLWGFF